MGKNWNTWKKFFTVSDRVLEQAAQKDSPSLEMFETRLDIFLCDLL